MSIKSENLYEGHVDIYDTHSQCSHTQESTSSSTPSVIIDYEECSYKPKYSYDKIYSDIPAYNGAYLDNTTFEEGNITLNEVRSRNWVNKEFDSSAYSSLSSKQPFMEPSSRSTANDFPCTPCPAHNTFEINGAVFSSEFDNGNLASVEYFCPESAYAPFISLNYPANAPIREFRISTCQDNHGETYQPKNNNSWFHFSVRGVSSGSILRIYVKTVSNHALYRHDMRPVVKSNSTNHQWTKIRTAVRYSKPAETQSSSSSQPIMYFEHMIEPNDDLTYFAFTFPYTYTTLQQELNAIKCDSVLSMPSCGSTCTGSDDENGIDYYRELLTRSCDGRRVELLTITSSSYRDVMNREPVLEGCFPCEDRMHPSRPFEYPGKEVVFISARVHPGEVPSQHTWKGIFSFLLDRTDLRARELRRRYVFKMIPMLNPDGVYRGHFRQDQYGHNLNRHYSNPDINTQPAIYAAKKLIDYYAQQQTLAVYLDLHAHSSKRGCFIYGNVMEDLESQIQNQLFCKLISLNTPHFDYNGCLFSKDHMARAEPGDHGLTAEGSGRVATYLAHGVIHSYTLECNYNSSKTGNEVPPPETDPKGDPRFAGLLSSTFPFTPFPEKYTPATYASVGVACVVALLDIRGHNPCSRIPKSKFRNLDKLRQSIAAEVKLRREYRALGPSSSSVKMADISGPWAWKRVVSVPKNILGDNGNLISNNAITDQELYDSDDQTEASQKTKKTDSLISNNRELSDRSLKIPMNTSEQSTSSQQGGSKFRPRVYKYIPVVNKCKGLVPKCKVDETNIIKSENKSSKSITPTTLNPATDVYTYVPKKSSSRPVSAHMIDGKANPIPAVSKDKDITRFPSIVFPSPDVNVSRKPAKVLFTTRARSISEGHPPKSGLKGLGGVLDPQIVLFVPKQNRANRPLA